MFNLLNNLTSSKSSNPMLEGQTEAEEFSTFFLEKLRTYMTNSQKLGNLTHPLMSKYCYLKNVHHFPATKYARKYSV